MGISWPLVHPIRKRQVLHPPMRRTAMVGDDVHNHLDATFVGLSHQEAIVVFNMDGVVMVVIIKW